MHEDEIRLRAATTSDITALARLHVRTFNETHGPGPDFATREAQWRRKFESGRLVFCIVLETPEGDLIGFASGENHVATELSEYRGLLDKIYLLRSYHRRGLGLRLMCGAARRFQEHGIDSMLLFGLASSPSNGFYEKLDGQRLLSATGEFHGGYGWKNLASLVAHCGSLREQARGSAPG